MKKIITTLFFIVIVNYIHSQDTIYYDKEWKKTSDLKITKFYKVIELNKINDNQLTENTYFKSGQIKSNISYLIDKNKRKQRIGKSSFWYESGELNTEIYYENGKKNGELISYWKNGILKRKDFYKNGKIKKGECWNENGEKVEYYDYEIHPKFPGGKAKMYVFIKKNLKYPKLSKQYNLGGTVVVDFKIDMDGKVCDIYIHETVNAELDSEAIRIIKSMPKWTPGYHNGVAVSVKYRIPINFSP